MTKRKKPTLKDLLAENRRNWDRTHSQAFTDVGPSQLLKQGHDIIRHHYQLLHQDIERGIQLHALIDQWCRSVDQRIKTLEYHFSWLRKEREDEDNSN